jgi:hypothetical protein
VPGPYREFLNSLRRYDLSRVFVWRTNINQRGTLFALGDRHDFGQSGPQVAVHLFDRVNRRGNAGCGSIKRSLFEFSLFAATIDTRLNAHFYNAHFRVFEILRKPLCGHERAFFTGFLGLNGSCRRQRQE